MRRDLEEASMNIGKVPQEARERAPRKPRGAPGRRTGKGKGRGNQVMGALKKAPDGLKRGPKGVGEGT
jgi:hypothetical protein